MILVPSRALWLPPDFDPLNWFTGGKLQRNPSTGKIKRNNATGKLKENSATNTTCCCGTPCSACTSGTGSLPATASCTIANLNLCDCYNKATVSATTVIKVTGNTGILNGNYTLTRTSGCTLQYVGTPAGGTATYDGLSQFGGGVGGPSCSSFTPNDTGHSIDAIQITVTVSSGGIAVQIFFGSNGGTTPIPDTPGGAFLGSKSVTSGTGCDHWQDTYTHTASATQSCDAVSHQYLWDNSSATVALSG